MSPSRGQSQVLKLTYKRIAHVSLRPMLRFRIRDPWFVRVVVTIGARSPRYTPGCFPDQRDPVAFVRKIAPYVLNLTLALITGGCGREDDVRPAEWDYISGAIFQTNCATSSCHSRAAAAAGLDFSNADRGYASLTKLWIWIVDPNATGAGCRPQNGTDICERGDRPLITPYVPSQSRLVSSLRARGSSRMPPDRPLTEADIELVERWILNGAFRDPAVIRARRGNEDAGVDASKTVDAPVVMGNDAAAAVTQLPPSDAAPTSMDSASGD